MRQTSSHFLFAYFHVCICPCICVSECVCEHADAGGHLGVDLRYCPPFPLRQYLSLVYHSLNRLAGQQASGTHLSPFPRTGIIHINKHTKLLVWNFSFSTWVQKLKFVSFAASTLLTELSPKLHFIHTFTKKYYSIVLANYMYVVMA